MGTHRVMRIPRLSGLCNGDTNLENGQDDAATVAFFGPGIDQVIWWKGQAELLLAPRPRQDAR